MQPLVAKGVIKQWKTKEFTVLTATLRTAYTTETHTNAQPVKLMFAVLAQSLTAAMKQYARLLSQEANYCL